MAPRRFIILSLALLLALGMATPLWAQNQAAQSSGAAAIVAAPPSPQDVATNIQKALQNNQQAQNTQANNNQPIDKAQLQQLLNTLQNPKQRDAFIANLKALLNVSQAPSQQPPQTQPHEAQPNQPQTAQKKPAPENDALDTLGQTITELGKSFSLIGRGFADLPETARWIGEQFDTKAERSRWLALFSEAATALIAGIIGFFLIKFLLRRPRELLAKMPTLSFPARLMVFGGYHLLTLLPTVAFTIASLFTLQFFDMPAEASQATASILYAFIVLQLCMWILHMVFCTRAPARRFLPIDDESAAYLYIWLVRLTAVIVFGAFIARAALITGVPENTVHAFASIMGLVVTLMVVIIVLQNRRNVADWLRGKHREQEEKKQSVKEKRHAVFLDGIREHLAGIWHILAILYLLVGYLVATLDIQHGFTTLTRATVVTVVVLLGFHFVLRGIDQLVASGFALPAELRRQFPRLEERTNSYLPILQRVLKVAVWVLGVLVLLSAWGVNTIEWLTHPPGEKVFRAVISIAVTLFVAVLVWEFVGSATERFLHGDTRSGHRVERSARMRTLIPLGRYTIQVIIVVVAIIVIFSEIGVNTTPFLAGAGIVGLAIGFGSQALVKDFITGLFILMEDTVSVGDIVSVGDHKGVVEGLTIRTIRLRDGQGWVHTVPFGEITSLINMTKHYSKVLLEIPVTFDADWHKVIKIMKDLIEEMRKEERFQKAIYDPLEVQGIDRYQDSWAIIMATVKTQPLQQWNVKREFLLRFKERLDANGISLPYPVGMNFPMSMLSPKGGVPKTPWNAETPSTPETPPTPKTPAGPPTPPEKSKTSHPQTKDEAKAQKNLEEAQPPPGPAGKA